MEYSPCYPPVKTAPVKPVKSAPAASQVHYVPMSWVDTHSMVVGYLFWLIGFTGAHRFYYGRPVTGILWFLTGGLLGIGWIVDLFLIPGMDREVEHRYLPGSIDYSVSWILLVFTGWLGLHRIYQARVVTGVLYLLTGGLFGVGVVYDVCTMNGQISHQNNRRQQSLLACWG